MSKVHLVHTKVIQSGDFVEIFHYSKGYLKGFNIKPNLGSSSVDVLTGEILDDVIDDVDASVSSDVVLPPVIVESEEDIKKRSLARSASKLTRLINSNFGQYGDKYTSKFLTLNFANHTTDLKEANYEFTKFMKRLNYKAFGVKRAIIKYTAVWELTKKGSIHYHVLLYNMPYIPFSDILDCWGVGGCFINAIDNVDNVGRYVGKYISKPDDRYFSEEYKDAKRYFCSKGLKKPLEITEEQYVYDAIIEVLKDDPVLDSSYTCENEHVGVVNYLRYRVVGVNLWRDVICGGVVKLEGYRECLYDLPFESDIIFDDI